MKSLVACLVALSVFCCIPRAVICADSAFDKGRIMLGGSISFLNYSGDRSPDVNTWVLAPHVMAFLTPGFALGAEISYMRVTQDDYHESTAAFLARMLYITPVEHLIKPYVQAGIGLIGMSSGGTISDYHVPGSDINGWTMTGGIGFFAFLNKHYAIRTGFDFAQDHWKVDKVTRTSNAYSLAVGFEGFIF